MLLLDELRAEHDLIERVAGAFLTFTRRPIDERPASDARSFVRFFRRYANDLHHAREEDVLFVALREQAGLPGDRGPIKVVVDEHLEMGGLLGRIERALSDPREHPAGDSDLAALATRYVHALWHHIDAENSVLFPESEQRLQRVGVRELPTRPMTDTEREAMADGERLCRDHPPIGDDGVMRGDGCVMCPAFGTTCRGLEAEWWNEWEWDEFEDRMNAG